MPPRRLFNKSDILTAAVIFALASAIYLTRSGLKNGAEALSCEITVDGVVERTVTLDVDTEFSLSANPHIHFEISDGKIAFTESDCPDQICVKTGFLSRSGQMAACLPNRVSIRMTGGNEEIDAVAE